MLHKYTMNSDFQVYLDDFDDAAYELIWTYYCSSSLYNRTSSLILPSIKKIKQDVIEYFHNSKIGLTELQKSHLIVKNRLISKEDINWIINADIRLIIWLDKEILKFNNLNYLIDPIQIPNTTPNYNDLKKSLKSQLPHTITPTLQLEHFLSNEYIYFTPNIKKHFVNKYPLYTIDNITNKLNHINKSIESKLIEIHRLETKWKNTKTPDNLIKWIDRDNKEQLNWAVNYLLKMQPESSYLRNIDLIDNYYFILICFDQYHYNHPLERQFFIEKMKKTWSQKKFRDAGKIKKPHHLPLTKATVTQLQKLAKIMNMKEHQIIELLVDEAFHNEAISNGKEIF